MASRKLHSGFLLILILLLIGAILIIGILALFFLKNSRIEIKDNLLIVSPPPQVQEQGSSPNPGYLYVPSN